MGVPQHNSIFIWKSFREWKPSIEDMFNDILTPEFEVEVRKNAIYIEYCNGQIECEKLIGKSIEDMAQQKISDFRQRYSHIRVYHACRTDDVSSYYKKGLLPSIAVKDVQVNRFREIFLKSDFPELTEEMLQQSVKKIGSKSGDLCLAIDDKHIIEFAGHYLIYGSEYLTNLVTQLPIEKPQQKLFPILRNIGKPTFIEIDLPIDYVDDIELFDVIVRMITEWVYLIAHSKTESCSFDCTFSLLEPLSSVHICSHYHPTKIKDPLMGYKVYDVESGKYACGD